MSAITWHAIVASLLILTVAVGCFVPGRILKRRQDRRIAATAARVRHQHASRPVLPPADREPGFPALTQWEESRLRDLAGFRAEASPGKLRLGTSLADLLRRELDLDDAELACVLLRVSDFAGACRDEQADAAAAFAALTDAVDIAAADLSEAELAFAPEEGVSGW